MVPSRPRGAEDGNFLFGEGMEAGGVVITF